MTTLEAALKRTVTAPDLDEDAIEKLATKPFWGVEHAAAMDVLLLAEHATLATKIDNPLRLDPIVFTWRWAKTLGVGTLGWYRVPLPKLVSLPLNSSEFFLAPTGNSQMWLPSLILEAYRDVITALRKPTYSSDRKKLCFSWSGIIPEAARATITEAVEVFGIEGVFLVTEAPASAWRLEEAREPVHEDPLIVGATSRGLYVLGSFDPTPLEEYVKHEFTS